MRMQLTMTTEKSSFVNSLKSGFVFWTSSLLFNDGNHLLFHKAKRREKVRWIDLLDDFL
jgi:hypothetical protein